MVDVGQKIPEISLQGTEGEIVLGKENKKYIVLVFYPEDETPVCASQLALYNEILPMIEEYDAQIIGISVDKLDVHKKFANKLNLRFPLLSDNDPRGKYAQLMGVYDFSDKRSQRALFTIDKDSIVRWKYISPKHVNPGADGILRSLEEINNSSKP